MESNTNTTTHSAPTLNDSRIFDATSELSRRPVPAPADTADTSAPAVEEKPVDGNPGYVVHDLHKPVTIDGKEVRQIVLDFDSLAGDAMQNIEAEMRADGNMVAVLNPISSATYCQYIAARAARMNVDDIRRLSFKDNAIIVMRVQNFITN